MKLRLAVLFVVCVLAFSFGFYALNRAAQVAAVRDTTASSKTVATFKHPRTKTAAAPAKVPAEKVVYVTNQFHWSQVESADYRQYIDNLRRVGCPEPTIRDIILTDIMRLYAARRGQFYHNGREFKFWETNDKRKLNARQLEEREKQLAQIDKEIPAVLRELLGLNYEREINKYFVDTNEDERRLNFISEDKRSRLIALRDQIEGRRERILQGGSADSLSAEQRDELAKIEEERQATLAKLLTPEELEEFELRTSDVAEHLREELIGFDPNEDEFRQIYSLQKGLNEKFSAAIPGNELVERERQAETEKLNEELRKRLGDQRYADYERARNPDFRDACVFSQLYELPQTTAASIFEIKQVAESEKNTLLASQNVSPAQLAEALKAIRLETEKSLLNILGTKLLSNYSESSGRWLNDLTTAN